LNVGSAAAAHSGLQRRAKREQVMKNHIVTGGGGIRLHLVETGNPSGPPIVFIHGFSQCWLAWTRQMTSDLANTCRILALDLRGHGLSDKPIEGYTDSKLWADDVHAIIEVLELDHPILCGWSYGPLVILDYIRHYGERAIRGVNFVGGVTKLGSDAATSVLTDEFLSQIPAFFSTDAQESVHALDSLVRMFFAHEVSAADHYLMLGYSAWVPPYVRRALFSRSFDNDDLLPKLRKPVLITHGVHDAIVKPTVIEQQMACITHARVQMIANAGHACFWDEAAAYNHCLQEFIDTL
jgi:pimeloyl-ACP methyl ester carboxylesterase